MTRALQGSEDPVTVASAMIESEGMETAISGGMLLFQTSQRGGCALDCIRTRARAEPAVLPRLVRPILDARFPGLPHSAALLGRGSEVLGFDDEMSTDHDWKPRVLLFLRENDHARYGDDVDDVLRRELPASFRDRPVDHEIHTVRGYFMEQLAVDVEDEIEAHDWLTFPEHKLRMLTAGEVYHDAVGLRATRDRLGYYPRDVWLYLLVAGWWRVHPEINLPADVRP